jgi:hypothetical protein
MMWKSGSILLASSTKPSTTDTHCLEVCQLSVALCSAFLFGTNVRISVLGYRAA